MRPVPPAVQARFIAHLGQKSIPSSIHFHYIKWLRYYLDFCEKYHFPQAQVSSLAPFLQKLQDKKQAPPLQQQARHAISLYYEILQPQHPESLVRSPQRRISTENHAAGTSPRATSAVPQAPASIASSSPKQVTAERTRFTASVIRPTPLTQGVSWMDEYAGLTNEIKLRHYSPKTLRIYKHWVRQYQTFVKSQDPKTLTTEHVKRFLTSLAVDQQVSASTQNLAFNALLFFHRHVLKKEFGKVEGVVRAKRRPYIPVVLSRDEIEAILKHLSPPVDLVVKLLYGCGLRLTECLHLRIHCFNFDAEVLTVHDGKGGKD